MQSIEDQNLQDLILRYREYGPAREGHAALTSRIRRHRSKELERLLRDHRKKPIWDKNELEFRDGVDYLLQFYSILEIACLARFVPSKLPPLLQDDIKMHLSHPAVRKYYEEFYPLFLPGLLLRRITGEQAFYAAGRTSESWFHFTNFLNQSTIIEADEDVTTYLWFLDDGVEKGEDISDLWDVLESPSKFVKHFERLPKKQRPVDRALHGLFKYLEFMTSLDRFLRSCSSNPILQSAFWHYHAYWFVAMKDKLSDNIDRALRILLLGTRAFDKDDFTRAVKRFAAVEEEDRISYGDAKRASFESIRDTKKVVDRLLDGSYGRKLDSLARRRRSG